MFHGRTPWPSPSSQVSPSLMAVRDFYSFSGYGIGVMCWNVVTWGEQASGSFISPALVPSCTVSGLICMQGILQPVGPNSICTSCTPWPKAQSLLRMTAPARGLTQRLMQALDIPVSTNITFCNNHTWCPDGLDEHGFEG